LDLNLKENNIELIVILNHLIIYREAAVETKPLDIPPSSSDPKTFSPKIQALVNDIANLNLLEVADLNECLKV